MVCAIVFCNKLSEVQGLESAYDFPENFEEAIQKNNSQIQTLSEAVKWNPNKKGYGLPTEAEWEYAARGGASFLYSGSDELNEVAWSLENSQGSTHPVGLKKANGYGIFDMTGNVCEWCWDRYGGYDDHSKLDPAGKSIGVARVRRGGSWSCEASLQRISFRHYHYSSNRAGDLGFRIALSS